MASTVAAKAKDIAADAVVSANVEVFLHSAAGGNSNGSSNRILTAGKTLAPARFTAASGGEVETANAENFGALSASASNTVRAYSVFLASDDGLLWIADMTTDVVVAANEEFEMDAGGMGFTVT